MFYPQTLQDFRTKLSLRRGQTRSVYEVLAPDLLDASYVTNCFQEGVFNSNKKHWAIGWSNHIFSFVWKLEHKKGESCVVGAKWVSYSDFLDNDEQDLHWIGYTSLNIKEIKNAGNWLCQYAGCPHVLWTQRSVFLEGLLYLILDDPDDHISLTLFKLSPEIFYFNPADAVTFSHQKKQEWKLCNKRCSYSKYLMEMKVEHNTLEECEEMVVRRIQYWNNYLGNIKIKEQLEARLNRKIWGMWLCNIL